MLGRIATALVPTFLLFTFCQIHSASAELWFDPEAPITWDAMLTCELVIVGKYESHQGSDVTLHVLDVLKGDAERGRPLTIKLEHLYTIETGPIGWDTWRKQDTPPDGIPKLCYKAQIINPGDLVPLPLLHDAREAAIYFFPKASAPALKRIRQVQPASQQPGWQQALAEMPMDLLFRLIQDANGDLARDALEELGVSRDPNCLDQLFAWVLSPANPRQPGVFESTTALARLGDKAGDVYDRAAKLLANATPGTNEYRFYPLATLMVVSDQRRAWEDLPKLIANKEMALPVRKASLGAVGRICTRPAAQLALEHLRDADLGEAALSSLRTFLLGDSDYPFPKSRGLEDREWLLEQLKIAARDEQTPAGVKKGLGEWFGHALRVSETPDLEQLRQRLLDPQDRSYQGWADGTTADMLRQARDACDSRVIPVLVEVLDKMPEASGNRGHGFQATLKFYATICPRLMAEELKKRGLPSRLAAIPSYERSHVISDAMEAANIWPSRFKSDRTDDVERCHRLAQRVREGTAHETELLVATEQLVAKHKLSGFTCQGLGALVEAGTLATRERFFAYVKDAKRVRVGPFFHEPTIGLELSSLLHELFPSHTKDYVEQVLDLLRSKSLIVRKAGVSSLVSTLQCDFDFDPEALEAERSQRLAELEPWLQRLVGKSESQARIALLSRAGLELSGEPNDSCLTPLIAVASGNDKNAVSQALRLIEVIVGEQRCRQFANWPQQQRTRALRAYLQDAAKLNP